MELILAKYFYINWKLTSKVVLKEEKKETFITEKEYSESRVEFRESLISQLLYYRKTKKNKLSKTRLTPYS